MRAISDQSAGLAENIENVRRLFAHYRSEKLLPATLKDLSIMLICVPDVLTKAEICRFSRHQGDACEWEDGRSTAGARVASFFWLQSMIRDAHARSRIFDLDTAIQSPVNRIGRDDPETVKLTSIYHNLIRYWAEA